MTLRSLRDKVESLRSILRKVGKPASSVAGSGAMIHITGQMRVLMAIEAVDGRRGSTQKVARTDQQAFNCRTWRCTGVSEDR